MGNQVLLLLVELGSSHSFVDVNMLHKLQVQTTPMAHTKVKVANGDTLLCTEQVKDMTWWLQGHTFSHDTRVLQLGGYDGTLGMDWLREWGTMSCNWDERWIEFSYNKQFVRLQGITPVFTTQWTSWSSCVRAMIFGLLLSCVLWTIKSLNSIHNFHQLSVISWLSSVMSLENLLHLPPTREYDHVISRFPDAKPVNSRPYGYSPLQKDEIERQVTAMSQASTIIPSHSHFASPVWLVKKKDGSWRFCIDYRKLNAITIKSKFPMPVVDELHDELAGTKVFSKLDLRADYHQIRMDPSDEVKTAFKTHHGQYQFRVMPFGLTNAPATFQCVMNFVFADYVRKFVLCLWTIYLFIESHWKTMCNIYPSS